MVGRWKKSLLVICAVAVLAGCWRAKVSSGSEPSSSEGISCIFLRKHQLMSRPDWRSKPLDVQTALQDVGKYDAFWCAQIMGEYNRPVWRLLRLSRPDQLMLFYLSAVTTRRIGGADVETYFDYDYINTRHPEWFLLKDARGGTARDHRDEDKRIRWNPSDPGHGYYNRFYLDVPNEHFQQWAADQVLDMVSGRKQGLEHGYDGLAMDNVYVGARLHERLRYKYPRWKYANNLKDWQKGFGDYLKAIRSVLNRHGYILVVNHNPVGRDRSKDQEVWDILYESADGILTEQALRHGWGTSSYFAEYFADQHWEAAVSRHEEVLEKGLINWWACQPSASGPLARHAFLYTYCSWLLIKKPGRSLYSGVVGSVADEQTVLWYDEYDLPIGAPTSSRYLRNSCWLRDYSNARIVVNPTRGVRRVVIDSEKPWLDWESKKAVRELTMPAQSGRILLGISPRRE